jgi:hypothetical protein
MTMGAPCVELTFNREGDRLGIYPRLSTSITRQGSALAYVNSDEWYRLKVEYITQGNDCSINLYIDDQLVAENGKYFYGSDNQVNVPSPANSKIGFAFYRFAKADVFIDNLKVMTK